ncbi:unnamed protein product [Lampetra fluviatilis]
MRGAHRRVEGEAGTRNSRERGRGDRGRCSDVVSWPEGVSSTCLQAGTHPQGKRNHQPVRDLTAPRGRKVTKTGSPHRKGEQKNLHYQRAATLFPMGP